MRSGGLSLPIGMQNSGFGAVKREGLLAKSCFVIGSSTLKLDIDISEQTKSDLSRYLSDFKADLWELIR